MPRLLPRPTALLDARLFFQIFDDFTNYGSGEENWTNLAADGGVTGFAESDAEHGVIQGQTGATDNNEIAVRSTNEVALFQADGTIIYETRLQWSEAATDDSNVAGGIADAAGANLLSDNGGGDNINDSGALIFKIDGGTVWRCAARTAGGTASEDASDTTAGGTSYQTLTIEARDVDGTNIEVTYFVDQVQLKTTDNVKIRHLLAFASATEMRIVPGYWKAGSANNETGNIDYTYFAQLRV